MQTQQDIFNQYCETLLAQYNRRNTAAITRRIDSLCNIIRQEGGHAVQTMLGGSVVRGTYVNGLSDVDILLIVNQSSLNNKPPADVIEYVKATISRCLPQNSVTKGNLAVTVNYSDGTEIQILPAIRTTNGVRIANPGSPRWSKIYQPLRFAEKLAKVNAAQDGRVGQTIKLAKAIANCFIRTPGRNITGYHMESLAIEAFRDYQGGLDSKTMLIRLFGNSIHAVMTPIQDPSGQSINVDDHLGEARSRPRKQASTYFKQMRAKVSSSRTKRDLDALFCEGSEN